MSNKNLYTIYYDEDKLCLASYKNGERKYMDKEYCESWMNNVSKYPISRIDIFDDDINLVYSRAIIRIADFSRFIKEYKTSLLGLKIIETIRDQKPTVQVKQKVERKNKYSNLQVGVATAAITTILLSGVSLLKKKIVEPKDNDYSYSDSSKEDVTAEITHASHINYSTTENGTAVVTIKETKPTTESTTKETTTETTTEETTTEKKTEEETSKTKVETTKEVHDSEILSGYNYINDPADGFIVTTGNKKYSISDEDFDLMCAVVMHEGGENPNEALAVASVMLNRCDSGRWGGTTPRSVITAKGQFESYFGGYYSKYLNGGAPDSVKMAVRDALNGVRNNEYESFRADFCTSYSDNMITSNGNRYR